MKLSQLRPCDNCGGPIAPLFYVVRTSIAVFNANATNENLGLMQMFQGSLVLAETMSSQPDAVKIGGEEDKKLWTEIYLCQHCYIDNVNLAVLGEKVEKHHDEERDGA